MFRILFICTGNSGRSQMAAAFAKAQAPGSVQVFCASDGRYEVHPRAVEVMNEVNLLIPTIKPYSLKDVEKDAFDVVITLCNRAREICPSFPGSPARIHWPILDPTREEGGAKAHEVEIFRSVRDEIRQRVKNLFQYGFLDSILQVRLTFTSLLDNLTDGVMAYDLAHRIYFFNSAAQRIMGLDYSQVIGQDCRQVFRSQMFGSEGSFCLDADQDRAVVRQPVTILRRDGQERDIEMSLVPVTSPEGDETGALVIFRDVTEIVHMRKKLQESRGFQGIIGQHRAIQEVFDSIRELADVNVPILIQGESGTGKEMVATALHRLSSRASGPFVPVNCGALPEGTLESELFGHVKGAFTGAIRDKKGRFELADGGTLFLDEIGEISPHIQLRLLRVLQEKAFIPVGGEKSIHVDVRILCATNKDLKTLTKKRLFREDLYYRLAVVPVYLPTLRERASDIPLLVDHFAEKFSHDTGMKVKSITPEAMALLVKYPWPGNVRELRNAVQYGMIKCQGGSLDVPHLPPEIVPQMNQSSRSRPGRPPTLHHKAVEEALSRTGGNKARAARLLEVSRTSLYRFLAKSDVSPNTKM